VWGLKVTTEDTYLHQILPRGVDPSLRIRNHSLQNRVTIQGVWGCESPACPGAELLVESGGQPQKPNNLRDLNAGSSIIHNSIHHYSPQFSSSIPSAQSLVPSHLSFSDMHTLRLNFWQRNSPLGQLVMSANICNKTKNGKILLQLLLH